MRYLYKMKSELFICFILFILACSNKKEEVPPPQSNIICAGINTLAFLPIQEGLKWTYDGNITYQIDSLTTSYPSPSFLKYGGNVFAGWVEFDFWDSPDGRIGHKQYFIVDDSGDVYSNNYSGFVQMNLLLKKNLFLGKEWNIGPVESDSGYSKLVISLSDTVVTAQCTYYNCLKLQYFHDNVPTDKFEWFALGIGIIKGDVFFIDTGPNKVDELIKFEEK